MADGLVQRRRQKGEAEDAPENDVDNDNNPEGIYFTTVVGGCGFNLVIL